MESRFLAGPPFGIELSKSGARVACGAMGRRVRSARGECRARSAVVRRLGGSCTPAPSVKSRVRCCYATSPRFPGFRASERALSGTRPPASRAR